jgi:hypothetical protein
MTEGHLYLKKEFNYTIETGWQIDTFGHSSSTPLLFKEMDFKYLVLNRINHRYKKKFQKEKKLEFYWNELFVHVLYEHVIFEFKIV